MDKKDCVNSLSGREQSANLFLKKGHGQYLIYEMKPVNVTIVKHGRKFYNAFIRESVKRVVSNSLDSRADAGKSL